ncbi:QcrA and Rieske domain-containing protein [Mycolicibacterium sarraceniae]|uniref:Cytochrome bc1 complex Rieske iron-sulfur subunit n=1 Tax=Mycolicibacterium sarraceniae TaxID=1534348 RepID=A0A7I7STL4_9MYCO|nr:Rieske (2Fe-2S) protein [Mycolicibacterium sarraceniae]BBY60053.1 Rieske iron-sulfur protein [Mycolicibacterium sarraceniae]
MFDLPRRTVLIGAAIAPIAACNTNTGDLTTAPTSMAPGQVLAATADIPVGSGKVVGDTVITQPTAGVFDGFVARCTHAGCALPAVTDGTLNCPCHGSQFGLDGAVLRGPAVEPLVAVAVKVQGPDVVAG